MEGEWYRLIHEVKELKLSSDCSFLMYQTIIKDLAVKEEIEAAKYILNNFIKESSQSLFIFYLCRIFGFISHIF